MIALSANLEFKAQRKWETYNKCSFSDEVEMSSRKAQMTRAANFQNTESLDTSLSSSSTLKKKRILSSAITEEQIEQQVSNFKWFSSTP